MFSLCQRGFSSFLPQCKNMHVRWIGNCRFECVFLHAALQSSGDFSRVLHWLCPYTGGLGFSKPLFKFVRINVSDVWFTGNRSLQAQLLLWWITLSTINLIQTDIKRRKTNKGADYTINPEKVKVADLGNFGRVKGSKTTRPQGSASSCFCIPSNPNSQAGGGTSWRNSWQISEEMSALWSCSGK